MLHRFSVSNYQSVRDKVTLDFRVPRSTPKGAWLRRPCSASDVQVPAVIAFVGRNGSGKTALLRALSDAIQFAVRSHSQQASVIQQFTAFASAEGLHLPTRIEIEFDAPALQPGPPTSKHVYRYTLELQRSTPISFPDRVSYEALHIFPQGRPRRLLERLGRRAVRVAREAGIRPNDDRLNAIAPNASVLATLHRTGVDNFAAIIDTLTQIQMAVSNVDLARAPDAVVTEYFRARPAAREQVSRQLRRFDLGIEKMDVRQSNDGTWHLVFSHAGLGWKVPFNEESAGARQVTAVFPALDRALQTGGLAVMDALDKDLHADIVDELIGWFRRAETNPDNAQLICSLHGLAALQGLEKEEIYIVDKSREGATEAYGISDVQGVRRDADFQKLYRSGTLGGIHLIG